MFVLTFILGLYAYGVYLLGLIHQVYPLTILIFTLFFGLIVTFIIKPKKTWFKNLKMIDIKNEDRKLPVFLFFSLVVVNLLGALGPELAFDALWYHLTLPKLYLQEHAISFIPGGLFYYSAMPQLGEMYYTASLALANEIVAKLIHFSFGLLTSIAIFKIAEKYYTGKIPFLIMLLFYSNLVVTWLSMTAYIDLTRSFFEVMAFWGFLKWFETRERKWLLATGLILGFAIATKLLALGSLFIFIFLLFYTFFQEKVHTRPNIVNQVVLLVFAALLTSFPWFVSSFFATGNPVFPFFTSTYPTGISPNLLNPLVFLKDIFTLFTKSPDPVSPIYLSLLPFGFVFYKKFSPVGKLIALYSFLALLIWYITPQTGGGRFITAYLPVLSLFVAEVLTVFQKQKFILLSKFIVISILVLSLITLVVRGYANTKYLPVLIGKQTKQEFLAKNLNFSFGDFYDTDGFFKKTITDKDRVLLIGFHNIFYVNFPFIHESMLKSGDKFNYIAVQHGELPIEYNNWHLVYENKLTGVKLYKQGKFVARQG